MHTKKIENSFIVSFLKISGIVVSLIGSGYFAGYQFGSNKFDTEKLSMSNQNNDLKDSIQRLQSKIRSDSLNRRNFILSNKNNIVFNNDQNDEATLLVSNSRTTPSEFGPISGTWRPWVRAKVGDTVSVQIWVHNCGDLAETDVSACLRMTARPNEGTVVFNGNLAVGNIIVSEGLATVFVKPGIALSFIPGSMRIYNHQSKVGLGVNGEKYLFTDNALSLGVIEPGAEGQECLVVTYKVIKE